MRPGRRLGIDVGTVRVGVAVSDPDGLLATPVATLLRHPEDHLPDNGDDESTRHLDDLAQLVVQEGIVEVVVGLPRHLDGTEGASAHMARQYAAAIAERVVPVPVRLVDERLSTVDAHRALRGSGLSSRRQRAVVDQTAAVMILQAALDAERTTGRPPGVPATGERRKPRTKGTPRE
ncbi:MAG: Holliday junction resolvase RuvX [Nostocoides sp.]